RPRAGELVMAKPSKTLIALVAGADLRYANLTGARLTSADLTSADLTWSNLSTTDFTNANLSNATSTGGTIFTGVIWSTTTCPDGTNSSAYSPQTCFNHGI
ncbi:MAG: pentapeptide repeat-containing protein, partial [Actinomycetes bacterium]